MSFRIEDILSDNFKSSGAPRNFCNSCKHCIEERAYSFQWNLYNFVPYNKRKGGQVRFTMAQTDALERKFSCLKYLSPEDRKILADNLDLTDRQVKTWFQNRRAKWRRSNAQAEQINN